MPLLMKLDVWKERVMGVKWHDETRFCCQAVTHRSDLRPHCLDDPCVMGRGD